jgi:hypothetical protein
VQWGHGHRLDLTLVALDDEFVYPPLSAEEPFAVGRTRRVASVASAAERRPLAGHHQRRRPRTASA